MFLLILVGGYLLLICEGPLSTHRGVAFDNYWNSCWCIIVTMTTVGYGFFYPITHPGRFIGFIFCVLGVIIFSFFIVVIT
mmetsp:Transcript_15871/g.7617  ORF Transcript_15871/g.7617 Transcript_15871/m.7617 type:complete len:80 (-) Transcript_15871:85-324(-)